MPREYNRWVGAHKNAPVDQAVLTASPELSPNLGDGAEASRRAIFAGRDIPLHAVGGTVLLVHADVHPGGIVHSAVSPRRRKYCDPSIARGLGKGDVETEGLGILAQDMGYQCWGLPDRK
jgi:hypothetical protein